jgi:hypothetical protein
MPTVAEMLYGKPSEGWKPDTKYLYTVATVNGWKHEDVKTLIKTKYGVDSTKGLSWSQYSEVIEFFDAFPKTTEEE